MQETAEIFLVIMYSIICLSVNDQEGASFDIRQRTILILNHLASFAVDFCSLMVLSRDMQVRVKPQEVTVFK